MPRGAGWVDHSGGDVTWRRVPTPRDQTCVPVRRKDLYPAGRTKIAKIFIDYINKNIILIVFSGNEIMSFLEVTSTVPIGLKLTV